MERNTKEHIGVKADHESLQTQVEPKESLQSQNISNK